MYLDKDNMPFYIGKGKGSSRWRPIAHIQQKSAHTMTGRKIKKLGADQVKVHFLHENLTEQEAYHWERYWIKYLGRRDNGTGQLTNHTDGGEGTSGWNCTEETKRKISKTRKARALSQGENNPMFGRKHTEEAKQEMCKVRKGVKLSNVHKQKISYTLKGRIFSPEHRKKLSEAALIRERLKRES